MQFTTARLAAIATTAGIVLFGANAATAAPQATTSVSKPIVMTIRATPIARIGGSFVANRTTLGSFNLPPGTWQIAENGTFNRTIAAQPAATKTRPQLALRYGFINYKGGTSAGTIAGVDISPAKDSELTGSTVQTVTTTAVVTTVWVYGWGVNDDGTTDASPGITVASQITATKIG